MSKYLSTTHTVIDDVQVLDASESRNMMFPSITTLFSARHYLDVYDREVVMVNIRGTCLASGS